MTVEILGQPTAEEIANAWGIEMLFDLTGCNPNTIRSPRLVRQFCRDLCDVIGMQRYRAPVVFPFSLAWLPRRRTPRFALDNPKVAGMTASQLIYTSNLTVHFIEDDNSACGNVFSCKPFDPDKALTFITGFFDATGAQAHVIPRGVKKR